MDKVKLNESNNNAYADDFLVELIRKFSIRTRIKLRMITNSRVVVPFKKEDRKRFKNKFCIVVMLSFAVFDGDEAKRKLKFLHIC